MKEEKCTQCYYFLDCSKSTNQELKQCAAYPSVKGHCQLWDGPLINLEICSGFIPIEKSQVH